MKQNKKFNSWILASRPKTLLAAFVPVMVGSALAINQTSFEWHLSLIALLCSVLIQVGTNFTNDLFDFFKGADNEKRKGPARVLASGLISVTEMKIGITIVFGLAFLLGLYLVNSAGIFIFIIGVLSIIAGIAYTAGPFPLAYKGFGDIASFIFFGLVGTTGTFYLHTHEISLIAVMTSLPVGALITNILVVNNFRDIEEDKAAGKNTLAVKLGKTFSIYEFIFFNVISFIIPLVLYTQYQFGYWIFLTYILIPPAFFLTRMLYTLNGTQLNKTLELTAKFSALYGVLFSIGLAL
jgi:1,4-dihydroxy-2-naphthoate octaprenyltransferase